MDACLQSRARILALALYDAIPGLPGIDAPTAGYEGRRYLSGNVEFSVRNGYPSRAISWAENGENFQLWFEIRGFVHLTRIGSQSVDLYSQSVFHDWTNGDRHQQASTFEGDINLFIACASKLQSALGRAQHVPEISKEPTEEDQIDSSHLAGMTNLATDESKEIVIAIPNGKLTAEQYTDLASIAYHDIPALPAGLGGFVALTDTNAEVQGYNPRMHGNFDTHTVVFRNSAALNLQVAEDDNCISSLSRNGLITIEHVKLG